MYFQKKKKKQACSVNLIGLKPNFLHFGCSCGTSSKVLEGSRSVFLGGLRALDLFFGAGAYSEHSQSAQILTKYF